MSRADRINERVKVLEQTLRELHGGPLAFAAASVAWFRVIQHGAKLSMTRVREEMKPYQHPGLHADMQELIFDLDAEHELMLRGYHQRLCAHLNVDVEEALELSKSFDQIVHDICFEGG